MRNDYVLPADDYESYFVPVPPGKASRGKNAAARLRVELERLHPGFTPSHEVDARPGTLRGERGFLVTVMREERLLEHRLLSRGCPLYAGMPGGSDLREYRRVFPKKNPSGAVGFSLVAIFLLAALGALAGLTPAGRAPVNPNPPPDAALPDAAGLPGDAGVSLPDGIALLALLAPRIAESGGWVTRLELSLVNQPGLALSAGGADPARMMASLGGFGLLGEGSLGEIRVQDSTPVYSLDYSFAPGTRFPEGLDPGAGAPGAHFAALRKTVEARGGSVEVIRQGTAEGEGALFCGFSAPLPSMGGLLENLWDYLRPQALVATGLSLEADREGRLLKAGLCLSASGLKGESPPLEGLDALSGAFGFRENDPDPPRKPATGDVGPERGEGSAHGELLARGWTLVGSIASGGGSPMAYWRDKEGKIHGIRQ